VDGQEVNEEDERALAAFMRAPAAQSRTLADLIAERLRTAAGEGGPGGGGGGGSDDDDEYGAGDGGAHGGMDPQVVEVYRGVGALLSRYKSGKVPKAFKIIPALANWEEVLYMTAPESWTPHATAAATRLFASNLNAKMAQRFFNLVLLPRVRADIAQNRRLHFTLFCALKKATYKPAAWFKGILLPLCAAGNCTLREVRPVT
jgi:essential nuclear protein 1